MEVKFRFWELPKNEKIEQTIFVILCIPCIFNNPSWCIGGLMTITNDFNDIFGKNPAAKKKIFENRSLRAYPKTILLSKFYHADLFRPNGLHGIRFNSYSTTVPTFYSNIIIGL